MGSKCFPTEKTSQRSALDHNVIEEFMFLILRMGNKEIRDIWMNYKKNTQDVVYTTDFLLHTTKALMKGMETQKRYYFMGIGGPRTEK